MYPQGNVLFYPWFIKNVNFNVRRDVGHISFFERIWCRNGIYKPIDCIKDEFFRFHNVQVMGLLWKEVRTMVHIIPRKVRGGHFFYNFFMKMKYGGTGRIKTT